MALLKDASFEILVSIGSGNDLVLIWHQANTRTNATLSSGCPAMSPHKIPWLFPDYFVVFPDHETYYRHFVTALTLILQAIWQITHQK